MSILVWLRIILLIHRYLLFAAVAALPLLSPSEWASVDRTVSAPDTIYLAKCSDSCASIAGATAANSLGKDCSCQCHNINPAFLPSARRCISKLEECRRQIPFEASAHSSRWVPAFTLPATNNIFAPNNKILWKDTAINVGPGGEVGCSLGDVFVQTDGLWFHKNGSELFELEAFNNTTYLIWKGSEPDARDFEGSIVQLKLTCQWFGSNSFCLAFRIAGVHVNANSPLRVGERQWNRIEVITCFLLAILLLLTVFGSIALWTICWRLQKSKLISKMQMQFLYHMKQQQQRLEEQIAVMNVNCVQRIPENNGDRSPPNVGVQKRKLYFSADFFEPEFMANPPQLAQQFVTELRKMIDIAKDRIKLKRHIPTLMTIGEEDENCEEYLEIPRPETGTMLRTDEPSPKSTKSTDSGCDSMSDEDAHSHKSKSEQDSGESAADKRSASRIPVVAPSLRPPLASKAQSAVRPNRAPPLPSSRNVSSRIPQNPVVSNLTAKMPTELPNGYIAEVPLESPTPPPLPPRSPPNLEQILSSVPPPLPDIAPPSASPVPKSRPRNGKRKTYAVFPSDNMLKKSLPRRSKKQHRLPNSNSSVSSAETSM